MLQINPFPGAWRLFAPFQQRQGFHHRLLRWKGVKTGEHHDEKPFIFIKSSPTKSGSDFKSTIRLIIADSPGFNVALAKSTLRQEQVESIKSIETTSFKLFFKVNEPLAVPPGETQPKSTFPVDKLSIFGWRPEPTNRFMEITEKIKIKK
jgi:hypothetical protein